ncbi:deoxyribose-phosphate aldolase [uncultured Eubacterium sp.]|uniref:deoxyribose-phosphate aldolase n=1 Tax=uncultured Eubacterium sp. TaxID=165185 RepID=UPI002673B3ED|nr:deoxyribose-phosphate aldolase [uncultured Eubacterium sp.]
MEIKEILERVDHTQLNPGATWQQIQKLCDEGMQYKTASVCIPPSFVKRAAEYVEGKLPICTVIGFPNGYNTTAIKCAEAAEAVENGASEIDMVINLGWVKEGNYDAVFSEINKVKDACHGRLLKVIVETCLLTEDEKVRMSEVVSMSKADYIKTSTGFSVGGATFEDVKTLVKNISNNTKIKAAGGIGSVKEAAKFIELGAERLGTSRIIQEIKE